MKKFFKLDAMLLAFIAASTGSVAEAQVASPPAVAPLFNQIGPTIASDNSAEIIIDVGEGNVGSVGIGDILVTIVGINTVGPTTIGSGTAYNEITALTAVKIADLHDVDVGPAGPDDSFGSQDIDLWEFEAVPLTASDIAFFDWATGQINIDGTGAPEFTFTPIAGTANDGELMGVVYEDSAQDYTRESSIQQGITSATNGDLRLVLAIKSENNDFLSVRGPISPSAFGTIGFNQSVDNSNIAFDGTIIVENWPGVNFTDNITGGNGGFARGSENSDWPIFDNLDYTLTASECSVEIVKTPDPDDEPKPIFKPGETAYFDIKVTNPSENNCTAINVVIDDDLPVDYDWTIDAGNTTDPSVCAITGAVGAQMLHCDVGNLAPGEMFTVRIETNIPVSAAAVTASLLAPSTFNATDGNLLLDNSEIPSGVGAPANDLEDWETFAGVIDCDTNDGCVRDTPSGQNDNSYTQGAKEDDKNPAVDFGSIPPSKDDLVRWYFQQEFIGTDAFLYLAWVRSNELATATIDFELNQSGSLEPNGVNPVRTEGDVLITYDFQGGRVDEINLMHWLTTDNPANTDDDCEANNGHVADGCWGKKQDLLVTGFAEGAVNFDDNNTNKPGDDGFPVNDPIENEVLPKLHFGEAAINLTGAFGDSEDPCLVFAQAFVKSRASKSFPSELKDFIAPVPVELSTCVTVDNTAFSEADNAPEVSDDGGFFVVQ